MFNVAEAGKPNKATIESIQAQHQAQNLQQTQAQLAGQVLRPPTANGIGPNPAQLASQAAQQGALAAQQNPQPPGAQRRPLPRNASQDQLAQRAQQAQNVQRQLQPTGSNAPTPMAMSSSPQVPIQRLPPATPRNIPGTPRQPGTPQPQSAQVKHPTPQPNGQAMTPASSQPSPMMKSSSQSDEGQQVNGTRGQFPRGPQGQMLNGAPQARTPAPQLQLPLPIAQFLETIKMLSNGQMSMTYEQFLGLPNTNQVQLIQKVQEYVQRRLAQQGGHPGNQQTVQGAYAQAFIQQAQRNAAMPIQPGQTMTPDQQRLFAQTRQQLLGNADPELLRQQLAQQGRLPSNEVQAMFQQQLLARQQQPQQQSPQLQQQANLAQARQLAALQQQAQAAAVPKMPNGNTMTPQQVQIFRARHLQAQAQARAQAQQAAQQNINAPSAVQQFMNAMSPDQRAQFQGLDGASQNQVYSQWVAKQQQMAAHQQQQQQQQQVQQGTPQLQYNPMAAQNMGATRMPVGPGMMMGQNGQVPTANGVGTTMMRQSTSGGGS